MSLFAFRGSVGQGGTALTRVRVTLLTVILWPGSIRLDWVGGRRQSYDRRVIGTLRENAIICFFRSCLQHCSESGFPAMAYVPVPSFLSRFSAAQHCHFQPSAHMASTPSFASHPSVRLANDGSV